MRKKDDRVSHKTAAYYENKTKEKESERKKTEIDSPKTVTFWHAQTKKSCFITSD